MAAHLKAVIDMAVVWAEIYSWTEIRERKNETKTVIVWEENREEKVLVRWYNLTQAYTYCLRWKEL